MNSAFMALREREREIESICKGTTAHGGLVWSEVTPILVIHVPVRYQGTAHQYKPYALVSLNECETYDREIESERHGDLMMSERDERYLPMDSVAWAWSHERVRVCTKVKDE